ncbi:MAG: hypothetical protein NVS3B21_01580 [Acidimicrobiales bacterium]
MTSIALRGMALTASILALAACGGSNKVGDKALLNIKEKAGGGFDPAATTTSTVLGKLTVASTTTSAPQTTLPSRTTVTKAPVSTTSTVSPAQQKAITATIKINADNSTSQFSPSLQSAYPGTPVQWVNTDVKSRSVVSDDGTTFNSGPIAPGASFTWTASGSPRRINYHDGTRPYAVAAINLVARP